MSATRILATATTLALGSLALVGCGATTSASGTTPSSSAAAPAQSSTASAPPAAGTPQANAPAGGGSTAKGSSARTTTGSAHHTASASGSKRVPLCRAGRLTVTAAPVSRPLNHLLITARNTSGSPCDLGIIGLVTFDGRIKAATPDGIGGGPNILSPGQANYEGVALDQQDAPGTGTHVSGLAVRFDSGDTVRIPVQAHVHAPAVTVWEPTAPDALVS